MVHIPKPRVAEVLKWCSSRCCSVRGPISDEETLGGLEDPFREGVAGAGPAAITAPAITDSSTIASRSSSSGYSPISAGLPITLRIPSSFYRPPDPGTDAEKAWARENTPVPYRGLGGRCRGRDGRLLDMAQSDWAAVDRYVVDHLVNDPATMATLESNAAAGLPPIDVSVAQGKFLYLLARSIGAGRVLEIGTLGGFSTLWLARAVGEQGRVITLEYERRHARVARENLDRAGVGDRVEIRVGVAMESLPVLEAEHSEPFDLVFIDADKVNNSNYVRWALRLTRPGSVIVVDNVVRRGALADETSTDPSVRASRELVELLAAEPRLDATVLQTVGSKGWDGFAFAVVI